MRALLFATCLLTVAACAKNPASPYPAGTSAIFDGERALELVDQCSRQEPGPVEATWTPTDADILRLEAALPALFEERLAVRWPDDDLDALDYDRQYGGLVIGGRKIVYINGVHRQPFGPSDLAQAIQICDGGPIAFGVEYDPATGSFANFAFNGAL